MKTMDWPGFSDLPLRIFRIFGVPRIPGAGRARDHASETVSVLEMSTSKPRRTDEKANAERAHAAILSRLEEVCRKPIKVRPPQSLQPTPEAAMSRAARLRKKRILIQRRKRDLETRTPGST